MSCKSGADRKRCLKAGLFILVFVMLSVFLSSWAFGQEREKIQGPDEARMKIILEDFEKYAVKGMKDWQIPGMAVAVIRGDKAVVSNKK